jgi:hypothetical protein
MTTILDDKLYTHGNRLAGRVVLITGVFVLGAHVCLGNQLATSQVAERASEGRQRSSVLSSSTSSLAHHPCGRIMCSVDRARLVLGDIDESAAQSVAAEIKRVGG